MDDAKTPKSDAMPGDDVVADETVRRALAVLQRYEPLIEHAVGIRARLMREGFPAEQSAAMAGLTYMAGIAPLIPRGLGGTA